jgi:hypothetical protein
MWLSTEHPLAELAPEDQGGVAHGRGIEGSWRGGGVARGRGLIYISQVTLTPNSALKPTIPHNLTSKNLNHVFQEAMRYEYQSQWFEIVMVN